MTKVNSIEHIKAKLEDAAHTLNSMYILVESDPEDEAEDACIDTCDLDRTVDEVYDALSSLSEALFAIGGYREVLRIEEQEAKK